MPFFDAKIAVALVFVILSFLVIFAIRSRTTTVITLIIAHLVLVLFLSLSISNYNSFKEIVLALVIYSMVLLFLISNHNQIFANDFKNLEPGGVKRTRVFAILLFTTMMIAFLSLFLVAKDVSKISKISSDKKNDRQNEVLVNPMILPSHPVHVAVRKFYLGKKMFGENGDWIDKIQVQSEINEKKQARLREKLVDNFLLKRSSDVIFIIVAISTSLLLLGARKNENNS